MGSLSERCYLSLMPPFNAMMDHFNSGNLGSGALIKNSISDDDDEDNHDGLPGRSSKHWESCLRNSSYINAQQQQQQGQLHSFHDTSFNASRAYPSVLSRGIVCFSSAEHTTKHSSSSTSSTSSISAQSPSTSYQNEKPTTTWTLLSQSQKDETIKTGKFLIAGGIAGVVSRTCVSPLERLKILFQIQTANRASAASLQYKGVLGALVHIWRVEGFIGFFKGNGTNVIRMIPYSAVQFASYEQYKKLLMSFPTPIEELNTPRRLLAGALAGVTSVIATYPLDLIRTRLSAQGEGAERKYKGIYDCFRTILREEGGLFSGSLFRGLSPTLMGVAPYVSLNFTVYETLKGSLLKKLELKELSVPWRLCCGAAAGAIAQTVTYPFDLVRRRMQMKGCSGNKFAYASTLDAFGKILKAEGFLGLYKGMIPNCLKVAPSMSISFVTYEFAKKVLFGEEVQGGSGAL